MSILSWAFGPRAARVSVQCNPRLAYGMAKSESVTQKNQTPNPVSMDASNTCVLSSMSVKSHRPGRWAWSGLSDDGWYPTPGRRVRHTNDSIVGHNSTSPDQLLKAGWDGRWQMKAMDES